MPQPYVVIDNRRKATQAAYVDPESLKKSRAVPILAEPHHNISPTSEEDILKFEDILAKKVDMSKVKIGVLKPWITRRIYEMLKMEAPNTGKHRGQPRKNQLKFSELKQLPIEPGPSK